MIERAIKKLVQWQDLEDEEILESFRELISGKVSPAQIAAFLVALRMKKETPLEIATAARVMYESAIKIDTEDNLIDTCGTGGDGRNTFNVSTIVGLILAAGGLKVAKHGNVAVSSHCGSADLLRNLGVNISLDKDGVKRCIEEVGFGFIFAVNFHPAMRYVTPIRRELGIRTIFNILGPLTNPAGVKYQLLGVYSQDLVSLIAQTMRLLNKESVVCFGEDGCDEISITTKSKIAILRDSKIEELEVAPEDFGLKRYNLSEIQTKNMDENVKVAEDILSGKLKGACFEIVILNAGFGFYIGRKTKSPKEGIEYAKSLLEKGKPKELLERLKELSNSIS